MNAGGLRHRVTFQRAIDTQDADIGEPVRSWDTANGVTAWAAVEPIRGQEGDVAGGVESASDTRIRARYSAALSAFTPKDRAVWDGKFYNVVEVRDIETRARELHFYCRSGLNAG